MKLPNITKSYTKTVRMMRKDYSNAKKECLKLLETSPKIGFANEKVLKTIADNLRKNDKDPNVGEMYWACTTQLHGILSDSSVEIFTLMNNKAIQEIFWDSRVEDKEKYLELPQKYYE
jgi:hypothetical protein